MAAALIDRLMHHCHVANIRGNSYRMREHTDLWHAIQPKADEQPASRQTRKREAESCYLISVQFSGATNEQFPPGIDNHFSDGRTETRAARVKVPYSTCDRLGALGAIVERFKRIATS